MDIYLYNKNNKNIFSTSPYIGLDKDWTIFKNALINYNNGYITIDYYKNDFHIFNKGFYKKKDIIKHNIPKDKYYTLPLGYIYLKYVKIEKENLLLYKFTTNNWEYHYKYDPNKIHI